MNEEIVETDINEFKSKDIENELNWKDKGELLKTKNKILVEIKIKHFLKMKFFKNRRKLF